MAEWIVDVISFQKIFGLFGLKGHIMEIRRGVTFMDGRRTDGQRNVKIGLEFCEAEYAINHYSYFLSAALYSIP